MNRWFVPWESILLIFSRFFYVITHVQVNPIKNEINRRSQPLAPCYIHDSVGGDDGLVVGYHLVCACARGFEPRSPQYLMVTTGGISRCKVCPGRRFPCSCTSGVGIVPLKKQL